MPVQGSLIDLVRRSALKRFLERLNGADNTWSKSMRPYLRSKCESPLTANGLFALSKELRGCMMSVGERRGQGGGISADQSMLSRAGSRWEALVGWYLNSILFTTNAVVVPSIRELTPNSITSAMAVNIQNSKVSTETDVLLMEFPDDPAINAEVLDNQSTASIQRNLDQVAESHFDKISVVSLQCKTNWNDDAQKPMLWSLIYDAALSGNPIVSVGSGAWSIISLKRFRYGFVTMPSNDLSKFTSDKLAVRRVSALSGGNYWGEAFLNGVAWTLSDLPSKCDLDSVTLGRGLLSGLNTELSSNGGSLPSYFDFD